MRTIAELSRITGIDYNTVKYYTKPVEKRALGCWLKPNDAMERITMTMMRSLI